MIIQGCSIYSSHSKKQEEARKSWANEYFWGNYIEPNLGEIKRTVCIQNFRIYLVRGGSRFSKAGCIRVRSSNPNAQIPGVKERVGPGIKVRNLDDRKLIRIGKHSFLRSLRSSILVELSHSKFLKKLLSSCSGTCTAVVFCFGVNRSWFL